MFKVIKERREDIVTTSSADMAALEGNEAEDANNGIISKLTPHELIQERKLGDQSQFASYIAYLKTQKPGQLPVQWSEQDKHVFRDVSFPGSVIVDWIDLNFQRTGYNPDDPFEVHMVEMAVQRSFDAALIPLLDMVNHIMGVL